MGFPPERTLVDHNNEETLALTLASGCWAGHSIYPNTKMDEARMVALVKRYGPERIIINSAADWGVSDPLKVPKTAAAMRDAGISEADIELIVWQNPVRFFAQSGRLDLDDALKVDQRQLHEGNSVLRGQTPRVDS
jgi:predicted metal-dependent TIM-barrel fold hydrolase